MLGLGALFLAMSTEYAPAVYSLLFGELLGVGNEQLVPTAVIGAICVASVLTLQRPLLLSAVAPDIADARGARPRLMELAFLLIIALMTTMAVPVVGALLTFSLLIGPPAAANSFTSRPWLAMLLSVVIAVLTIWSAIALAYLNDLPIGFLVGGLAAVAYAAGRGWVFLASRFGIPPREAARRIL
jgi:zinc/manganese transport system permease protein